MIGSLNAPPLAAVSVAVLALAMLAAESWTDAIDKGNRLFAKQEYEEALASYRRAEADALDPGLASFNIGAACYRLKRYAEAERHYRRTLDDDAIPDERRGRAWFDLGNTLLQQAQTTDRRQLEQAMTAYRHCLEGSIDAALRRDAEFNLELAGHRWRLAKPPPPGQGNDPTPDPPTPKNVGDDPPPRSKKNGDGVGDPRKDGSKSGSDDPDGSSDSKRPALGPVTVLPDHGERAQLSPAEAEAHLDQHLTRILREVRGYRERTEPAPRGKDW